MKYTIIKQINMSVIRNRNKISGTMGMALSIALQGTACSNIHYGIKPQMSGNIVKTVRHWCYKEISKSTEKHAVLTTSIDDFKNYLNKLSDIRNPNKGEDLLYLAIYYNQIDKVKCILNHIGSDRSPGDMSREFPNIFDSESNRTPLGQAIYLGYKDIVEELLSRDSIDPNKAQTNNISALMLAIQLNKPDIALSICNQLCNQNDRKNIKGINTQEVDDHGRTLLHLALEQGKSFIPVIKLLIHQFGQKSHLSQVDNEGYSPLTVALKSGFGDSDIVTELMSRMDQNHLFTCSERKQFPLHIATEHKNKGTFISLFNSLCKLHNGNHIEIMNTILAKDNQSKDIFTYAWNASQDMFHVVLKKIAQYMQEEDWQNLYKAIKSTNQLNVFQKKKFKYIIRQCFNIGNRPQEMTAAAVALSL